MRIGMEYSYALPRTWWHEHINTMPYCFTSFRLVEELAAEGHDVHMFVNSDVEEMTYEVIRGVNYHFSKHGMQMAEETKRSEQFDTFLFNGHPPGINICFPENCGNRPKKLIQRLHMNVAATMDEIAIGRKVVPDLWLVYAPSEVASMIELGISERCEWVPIGVDAPACIEHKTYWHARPYDLAVGGCNRWKGYDYGKAVAEECRKLGVSLPLDPMICNIGKPDLYKLLGSIKFIFYPSMHDAVSPRFMSEAHFCGCRIFVAAESVAMVLAKQFYDIIPVVCGGSLKPFRVGTDPSGAEYTRPAAETAHELASLLFKHLREQDRSPLDATLTIEYEKKRLKEILTTL